MIKWFLVLAMVLTSACADSKVINGRECEPYGVFDEETKCPGVKYRVAPESVVWAVLTSGGVVIPLYMVGWALWEPVGPEEDE